jgi:hypothetical protein
VFEDLDLKIADIELVVRDVTRLAWVNLKTDYNTGYCPTHHKCTKTCNACTHNCTMTCATCNCTITQHCTLVAC